MTLRRHCYLALLLPLVILAVGCSDDDSDEPELELVHYPSYSVPLVELAGTYHCEAEPGDDPPRARTVRFGIPAEVDDFQGLRLVAGGTWTRASVEVSYEMPGGWVVLDTFARGGTLDLELVVVDDPGKVYRARGVPLVGGTDGFTFTVEVDADWPAGTVDAADLLGQGLDATLTSNLDLGGNERLLAPAHGEVTEVFLRLGNVYVYEDVPCG